MSDERLRQLERAAACGGDRERAEYARALCQTGIHDLRGGTLGVRSVGGAHQLVSDCAHCGGDFPLTDLTSSSELLIDWLAQTWRQDPDPGP